MKDPAFVELYDLIERAVNMPACRFDIPYDKNLDITLPHLAKMRNLAKLVANKIYILSYDGENKNSWESVELGIRLSDSLANEPTLISQLVRCAMDETIIRVTQTIFNLYPNHTLTTDYQKVISAINRKDKYLTKGLEAELAFFSSFLKTHYNLLDYVTIYGTKSLARKIFDMFFASYLAKPLIVDDHIFYVKKMTDLISLANSPFSLVETQIEDWGGDLAINTVAVSKRGKRVVSSILLPATGTILVQQANYNASLDSFKLALALKIYREKHGSYPDTLAPLAPEVIPELPLDPFTGKDYIYRKEGKGFIVYSVGPNEKDDNGINYSKQKYDDISFNVTN